MLPALMSHLVFVLALAAGLGSMAVAQPVAKDNQGSSRTVLVGNMAVPNQPVKDKWALIIGVSNFSHPEYNLKYSAKDAVDFRNFLVNECKFSPDHVLFCATRRRREETL